MIELERNPPNFVETYLDSLNICFPGWGDRRAYDWAFQRDVSGPRPDLMALWEGGALLAGSAVSYRTLKTMTGQRALVGIMTGSWTLPAARGRGCFTRIIDESLAMVGEHGGAFLMAYVTETNASLRRLESAGSSLFPTRYVVSQPETPSAATTVSMHVVDAKDAAPWYARFEERRTIGATMTYASSDEWRSQFLDRPGLTYIVDAGRLGFAVVEEHGDFDRLQGIAPTTPGNFKLLVQALLARAQARGRRVFFFSSEVPAAEECSAALKLGVSPGFLTLLPADRAAAAAAVDSDQVIREGLAGSPAFGRWSIQSGDRM